MNSGQIVVEMIFLKVFTLKNVYYAVLHTLPCNPSHKSPFPEVSSLSTICFHDAYSISAAIIC